MTAANIFSCPRRSIDRDLALDTLSQLISFHGHLCPGLALGARAAAVAVDEVGTDSSNDEMVAIIEAHVCGIDAVQFLTGCTVGKANLVQRNYGKLNYTFFRRESGRGIRLLTRPESIAVVHDHDREELFSLVRTKRASPAQRDQFSTIQRARSEAILAAPITSLFHKEPVELELPRPPRTSRFEQCAECGEPTNVQRIRRYRNTTVCIPCLTNLAC